MLLYQILSWFGDNPSGLHPFSIHRLMESAVSHGNTPGDWFGPSQVAMLIRLDSNYSAPFNL